MTKAELFAKAKAADKAFTDALIEHFGKNAGDMRYQPSEHPPHIAQLPTEYLEAIEAWRAK